MSTEMRRARRVLSDLVVAIEMFIAALDVEMKKPSTNERGGRIAVLLNSLEIAKDRARYAKDGLDIDFRTNKRRPSSARG